MWKRIGLAVGVIAAVCAGVVGIRPVLGQQLISSFEGDFSSTVGATWGGPGIANSKFVSVGATEGTMALAISHPTSWNIQLILSGGVPLAQAVADHDFLVIDVTTQDLGVAADMWSPSWRQLFTVINSNEGGWQQQQNDYPVAGDDGGFLTQTVILDLNQDLNTEDADTDTVKVNAQQYVAAGGPDGTYFELFLPMQGGDQGTPIKAGDYGDDNVVNAADYVVWRGNEGGTSLTNETVTLGSVDSEDYNEWRNHFGTDYTMITTIIDNVRFANAGSGALAALGVPEPTTAWLALSAAMAFATRRRSRR